MTDTSFTEMRKRKSGECILLVHFAIIKRLDHILQSCSKLKMEELCFEYEAQHEEKLNYFITSQNELVLEGATSDYNHSENKNSIAGEKMPRGWSGLEELVKKIDFSNVLNISMRKVCNKVISAEDITNYESVHFYCEFSDDKSENKMQNLKIMVNNLGRSDIPHFFDKVAWKLNHIYTGVVTNIYDPSKFWMRFADIQLIQHHLWEFYSKYKDEYLLPLSEICIGTNCAVFLTDSYYRGRIVRTDIQDHNSFIVFLYDYGMIQRVNRDCLFNLHEKFGVFPALAVRCTLTTVSPIDNESWTQTAVERFNELTNGDRKLTVKVTHIKSKRKILEVYLADIIDDGDKIPTFNYQLVHEKLAKISWQEPLRSDENETFKRLREFTYLFPTHEMIENGTAPANLALTNKLKECVSWDVLFPELYKYRG